MGHKWLEAFSKAVTYLGSGVTALTGTMQAAQQQEQIDAAWAATAAYAGCGRRVRGIHSAGRADG